MKVMVCIPTSLIDSDSRNSKPAVINNRNLHLTAFRSLIRSLRDADHQVYCFLDVIGWEKNAHKSSALDAVKRDWEEVHAAEHVIACPTAAGSSSRGVHVEIGWATALEKPLTILLQRPKVGHTVLVTGLDAQPTINAQAFYYDTDPTDTFPDVHRRITVLERKTPATRAAKVFPLPSVRRD